MSLGTFFRDYVYIPLGGNRRHQLFNIFIVWFLTGFWHGASWNFILWGLYYGIWLIIEKKLLFKFWEKVPAFIQLIYSNLIVLGGWMLFYFTDLSRLKEFLFALFGQNPKGINIMAEYQALSHIWFIILMFICVTPIIRIVIRKLRKDFKTLYAVLLPVAVTAILLVCFTLLVKQSYNPFLYFRF